MVRGLDDSNAALIHQAAVIEAELRATIARAEAFITARKAYEHTARPIYPHLAHRRVDTP